MIEKSTEAPSKMMLLMAKFCERYRSGWMLWIYLAVHVLFFYLSFSSYIFAILISLTTLLPMSFVLLIGMILSEVTIWFSKSTYANAVETICRHCFAWIVKIYGKIFHGYVIHGLDNLEKHKAGIVVFYHAVIPLDVSYVAAELYLKTGRVLGGICHRDFAKFRNSFMDFLKFSPEKDRLIDDLKKGNLRAIAPGGEIETIFSANYSIEWDKRVGVAKVAKSLGVPVFPLFTTNNREAMPVTTYGFYGFMLETFRRTRQFLYFPLIILPAKLHVYVGEALFCEESESAEAFTERVKQAIRKLQDNHQRRPPSILAALLDRFH